MARFFWFCLFFFSINPLVSAPVWPASYSVQQSWTCVGCQIQQPENALSSQANDYATLHVPVGILSSLSLELTFPVAMPPGAVVSLVVEDPFSWLNGVSYQVWHHSTLVPTTGWTVLPYSGAQKLLIATATAPANKVSVTLTGLVSVAKTLRVYNVSFDMMPLPLALLSFQGTPVKEGIQLSWQMASQEPQTDFEVQRSRQGTTWQPVGERLGVGKASQSTQYQLLDRFPAPGVNYYRLKLLDSDGQVHYSKVISLVFDRDPFATPFTLFPNPARSGQPLFLMGSGSTGRQTVRLCFYDQQGKMQSSQQLILENNQASIPIPACLPSGVYTIQVYGLPAATTPVKPVSTTLVIQ